MCVYYENDNRGYRDNLCGDNREHKKALSPIPSVYVNNEQM